MKYSALTWVIPATDDILKQARQSLEQFVENPSDSAPLQDAVNCMHEIRGALTLLEISTASLLVHEMELVTQELLSGSVPNKELAYDILMRGMIQLPNYLVHLSLGYPDMPLALLPIINKLRAMRKQQALAPSSLFMPDQHVSIPVKPAPNLPDAKFKEFINHFRVGYHKGLLVWLKAPNLEALKAMLGMLDRLLQVTGTAPISKAWWVTAALLEAVAQKGVAPSENLNAVLKQLDPLMKQLADHGSAALRLQAPHKLMTQLLFMVGNAKSSGPRLQAVREAFSLDSYMPSEAQLQASQQIFSGPNIELMSGVVGAIRDDFARVEETLDIFMRADNPDVNDLAPLVEVMRTMAYTLRLLDLEVQCSSMLKQAEQVEAIVANQKPHELPHLLAIADALLKVNAALDTLSNRGIHARQQIQQEQGLLETQYNTVLRVAVDEAKTELAETVQPIVSFIETGNVSEELMAIPERLRQIQGFLEIKEQTRAIKLVKLCAHYIAETLVKTATVPAEAAQKALADTLISLEFYLDTLAGNPMDADQILDITERCLRSLLAARA